MQLTARLVRYPANAAACRSLSIYNRPFSHTSRQVVVRCEPGTGANPAVYD